MNAGVHQYEDKLLDYAYGELPAHEAAAVDAHVRTCAKCSQSLAQMRGVRSVFAPLPMEAAPDTGLESLLAYAEQHARRAKAPKEAPWRRWVLALASAAGLVVVGVVALRAADEAPQSPAQIVADAKRAEVQATESLKKLDPVVADLPAPAPTGAVARESVPASPKPLEAQAQYGGEREGKRGAVEQKEWAPADKLVAKKPRPPSSVSGGAGNDFDAFGDSAKAANAAPAEKKADLARSSETRRVLRDDYGNAGRAVALQETKDEAPKRELSGNKKIEVQARERNNLDDQLNDGASATQGMGGTSSPAAGFGLGTGSAAGGLGRTGVESAARQPSLSVPQTMPPPPPAKSKSGYGLPGAPQAPAPVALPEPQAAPQAGPRDRARAEAVVDSAAYADEESRPEPVAQRKNAEADRRAQAQLDVRRFLEEARAASKQGDRRGEVLAAANALKAGATGYERAEALRRACDAHEAMQEFDRAEPFCERLLSEFSGTVAARQVMERRAKLTGKKVAPMKAAPADVGASEAAH